MTRRRKIIIVLVLILIAVILFFLFYFRNRPESPPPATVVITDETTSPVVEPAPTPVSPEMREERINAAGLMAIAKTFAERYGSFSNEADYANVRDVLPLMSSTFKAQSEKMLADAVTPEGFYTVNTKVVSTEVVTLDEVIGRATINLSTQREESKDEPQNISVRYQTIILTFTKEGGDWKVDSALWQ